MKLLFSDHLSSCLCVFISLTELRPGAPPLLLYRGLFDWLFKVYKYWTCGVLDKETVLRMSPVAQSCWDISSLMWVQIYLKHILFEIYLLYINMLLSYYRVLGFWCLIEAGWLKDQFIHPLLWCNMVKVWIEKGDRMTKAYSEGKKRGKKETKRKF